MPKPSRPVDVRGGRLRVLLAVNVACATGVAAAVSVAGAPAASGLRRRAESALEASCGRGHLPEGRIQGRVPVADRVSGQVRAVIAATQPRRTVPRRSPILGEPVVSDLRLVRGQRFHGSPVQARHLPVHGPARLTRAALRMRKDLEMMRSGRVRAAVLSVALIALMVGTTQISVLVSTPSAVAAAGRGAEAAGAPGTREVLRSARAWPASLAGPRAFRRAPAAAPQLTNSGKWRARPPLVSGVSVYRAGEFVYQDFIYDDRGAGETPQVPGVPRPTGTYEYPTDPRYAGNAADLLEFRLKPDRNGLLIRLTYNSMIAPGLVATTVALGSSGRPVAWPHGAGAQSPAKVFVTVHGRRAEVVRQDVADSSSGKVKQVTVDHRRRQIEFRVPRSVFNPPEGTFRIAAASGLWDPDSETYVARSATAGESTPGGSASGGSELVNVAFRNAEPVEPSNPWRERAQAMALSQGDLSDFYALVDMGRLRASRTGGPGIPHLTGDLNRIVVSHFEEKQGRGGPHAASGVGCGGSRGPCDYSGRLQPYSLHVPARPGSDGLYGLILDLHNANQSHNVRAGTDHVRAMAREGYLVVTPGGRGPTYWYDGLAQVDVWEVLADVLRRYPVARDRIAIAGTSMGGYGAYKLAATFPSLFSALGVLVPCTSADVLWPGEPTEPASGVHTVVRRLMPSMRNVPTMSWVGAADELCGYSNERSVHEELVRLGYRTSFWTFPADHQTLSADRRPLADFLHRARSPHSPDRVTYVVRDRAADRRWGLEADTAYWLTDARLRDMSSSGEGFVDAVTFAAGGRATTPVGPSVTTGVLQPASSDLISVLPAYPYTREDLTWSTSRAEPARDLVVVRTRGLESIAVNLLDARLTCRAKVLVESDGPVLIHFPGCPLRRPLVRGH